MWILVKRSVIKALYLITFEKLVYTQNDEAFLISLK